MTTKRCAAAAVLALVVCGTAGAAEGDWLARARIIRIAPDASSSTLNLDVNKRTTLELDFSYFLTRNVALELILATKKHTVTSNGGSIGTVTHLPPTLTVQYHFAPEATIRPYAGVGLNYTRFYDIDLGGGTLTVDRNSFGGALQVGSDFAIDKRFFLNVDVKKIWIETDVKTAAGAHVTNLKINPWIFGAGVGIKF